MENPSCQDRLELTAPTATPHVTEDEVFSAEVRAEPALNPPERPSWHLQPLSQDFYAGIGLVAGIRANANR